MDEIQKEELHQQALQERERKKREREEEMRIKVIEMMRNNYHIFLWG